MPVLEETAAVELNEAVVAEEDQTAQPMPREKKARYRRFAMVVFSIFAPVQFYIGWRLIPDLPVNMGFQMLHPPHKQTLIPRKDRNSPMQPYSLHR